MTVYYLFVAPARTGVTGLICAVAILADRRLHAAMTLLANYCAMPVEIPLIIPFMRLGEWVTGVHPIDLHPSQLWHDLKADPSLVLPGIGCAVLGWLLLAVPVAIASFYASLRLIRSMRPRPAIPDDSGAEELLDADDESEMAPLQPHAAQD
uniref:DUF2062 domain-containing protein n=1 Tax=Tetraselmis chuii TaxID=63592 RepID=A0A6U1JYV7_9CHLO|mmetsp:Transcript_40558/g.72857  ORF Transcript_40558/g.72857 Transcript_40558/m.72857 type:complete len:152 (+) Transcript_40558:114-569(+)